MRRMRIDGNSYINDSRKLYNPTQISQDLLNNVTDFSYEMCFGIGHHRRYRTGGQMIRRAGEQFCNTFQGKLSEVVLRDFLLKKGLECGEPDFKVYGEGVWDDTDLVVNNKSISVKSAAHFSNLLLLERKDYDENGNYLPNLNSGATASYDYYILVRLKPDLKGVFKSNRLLYSDDISRPILESIINSQDWSYDIAGWISHDDFVSVIKERLIIPQKALLNGRIPMDAENYYIQSGDMRNIEDLVRIL